MPFQIRKLRQTLLTISGGVSTGSATILLVIRFRNLPMLLPAVGLCEGVGAYWPQTVDPPRS